MMNYALKIKEKRVSLGLTQKDFADALGMGKFGDRTLRRWECGETNPSGLEYKALMAFANKVPYASSSAKKEFTFIDLFAGIGGIRIPFQELGGRCVFSSEWDAFAQKTYKVNFGETPSGDITKISSKDIPDFDILLAGFPCQPFSQAGLKKGFTDVRGTMFFEIERILKEKRPKAFLLENVKQLKGHDKGRTFQVILDHLNRLEYAVDFKVLKAADFGVPQNRERVFCISMLDPKAEYIFPEKKELKKKMKDYLEREVSKSFYLRCLSDIPIDQDVCYCIDSNYWKGSTIENFFEKRRRQLITTRQTENGKYLIRRLTPKEAWRLMGCSDEDFEKAASLNSNTNLYRQAGNSIVVPVLEAVFEALFKSGKDDCRKTARGHQYSLL